MPPAKRIPEGVTVRHTRECASRRGKPCDCKPTYQAQVWSPVDRRRRSRTFATPSAAASWRTDTLSALKRGTLRFGRQLTISEAAEEWLTGAKAGMIYNRSGDPFKPSVIRGYERSLRQRVMPALGTRKLAELRRREVQEFVGSLVAKGLDPSTIRNILMPLRAIFRQALSLDDVALSPVDGVQLPAVRGKRERIATPEKAEALLAALPAGDRPLWATALYAGLRLAELQALAWEHVDLAAGVIRVEQAWDPKEGPIKPKSRAGQRSVPVPAALRDALTEHRAAHAGATGLVFGRTEDIPFAPTSVWKRARDAWEAAKLEPIGLHECRHTYASLMIAAGVNAKALSTYLGHANISITIDRYGHLMPGNEEEAAGLLDAYLERASSRARKAAVGGA